MILFFVRKKCYGGVIILGVKEEKDGSWKTTGLQNAFRLRKDFWDTINNSKKWNINLLSEDDVQTYELGDNKDVINVLLFHCIGCRKDLIWQKKSMREDRKKISLL